MSYLRPYQSVRTGSVVVHIVLLGVIAALMLSYAWTGYAASDDSYYVSAGRGWLHHFPFVSHYFGTMRELVNIPIALSIACFGDREVAMVLPSALYFFATVLLTYGGLSGVIGARAALLAGIAMLTVPLFVLKATIPSADLALLFFAALTFWLYWRAIDGPLQTSRRRGLLLFSAGLAAGAAFLSHELALALPVFFTILFVIGFRLPRSQYFLILFGFLVVIGLNSLYYWAMTGDALHRLHLMQEGSALTVDRIAVPPFHFDDSGNFHIWAGIDPLVMLLTKQEFTLLFYLALPAMIWLSFRSLASETGPETGGVMQRILVLGRLLTLLALVWGLFSAIVLMDAKLLPRYFMMPAWCSFVVLMLAATLLWRAGRRGVVVTLAFAFVGCNLLAISMDNRNPRFGERALAAFAQTTGERIRTDPMTLDKAEFYLQWAHVPKGRVQAGPPEPGELYFYNPKNTDAPNRLIPASDLPLYKPEPQWTKVWTEREPPRLVALVIDGLGLGPHLPERIYRKLRDPNPPVTVYRLDQVYADASSGGRD